MLILMCKDQLFFQLFNQLVKGLPLGLEEARVIPILAQPGEKRKSNRWRAEEMRGGKRKGYSLN